MQVKTQHKLGSAVAIARLQDYTGNLPGEYRNHIKELQLNWKGAHGHFSFKAAGVMIRGNVLVTEEQALVDVNIPLMFFMLKEQIEKQIKQQMQQLLRDK